MYSAVTGIARMW